MGTDGLPRPIRGPVPKDASRRIHRRRFSLQHVGLEARSLPRALEQLVLEHWGPLEPQQRQLLANACLSRGLDIGRLSLVFNLLGDEPIGDTQLQALAHTYARSKQPGENFVVTGFERYRETTARRAHFALYVQVDGRTGMQRVILRSIDLGDYRRFAVRCVEFAAFMPLFRDLGPRTFLNFVDGLMTWLAKEDEMDA